MLFVGGGALGIWFDFGDGFDAGGAGLFDAVPHARADASQERDAVRWALGGIRNHDGAVVDVGLELAPERAASAAAGGADFADWHVHFAHDFQGIAHAEGDAFH